jgi:ribosomal protein S18 acetylase RimI-like enzyme
VADLVETCFADTLDPDGKRYIERMRSAARNKSFLRWAALNIEIPNMPFSGYVWEQDGEMIGNASLIPYRINGRPSYLIANVAVHPDYRQKGIARALTKKSMEHAIEKGAPEIWLHVREENERAIALYNSLNFQERARRTTWTAEPGINTDPGDPDVKIGTPSSDQWHKLLSWIEHNYPPEVTWHLPLYKNALRSGIYGFIFRIIYKIHIRNWTVSQGAELKGGLYWQSSSSYADSLWLAAPADAGDQAVRTLLNAAQQSLKSERTLRLEYPAGQSAGGIQSGGFSQQQTLIWMSLDLANSGV